MIILLLLQLTIDSAIEAYNKTDYERAYNIAFQIELDSTNSFHYYEVLELRAYTSTSVRKFKQADSLFNLVFETDHKSILAKAYVDYAELQHLQFNFDKRISSLERAYELEPRNQTIRIITEHYFLIEADYELAEKCLNRHTSPETAKDSSGYYATLAQLAESKRQYKQAIEYYSKSKISAQKANLFSYELFAAEGLHRSKRLLDTEEEEKMINYIVWLILSVGIYYYIKKNKLYYAGINQPKD